MSASSFVLVVGSYNTSSWSLRAWLALRAAGFDFELVRIPLRLPVTPELLAAHSPSGKVPVLVVDDTPIWDSMAIAEFLAELRPELWPTDARARAIARAAALEMHSGFPDLRRFLPMDITARYSPAGKLLRGVAKDIRRICALWSDCRARFGEGGPFLFGEFSIADAMFAPVASRFVTYGIELDSVAGDYVDSVMSWPAMTEWQQAASAEVESGAGEDGAISRAWIEGGTAATVRPAPVSPAPAPSAPAAPQSAPAAAPAPVEEAQRPVAPPLPRMPRQAEAPQEPVAPPEEVARPAVEPPAVRTWRRAAHAGEDAPAPQDDPVQPRRAGPSLRPPSASGLREDAAPMLTDDDAPAGEARPARPGRRELPMVKPIGAGIRRRR